MNERVTVEREGIRPVTYTVPDEPHRFSNSELSTFKWCKRNWWLAYYQRLGLQRADPVSAAGLGTLVHLGLEVWYETGDSDAAVGQVRLRSDGDLAHFAENEHKVAKITKQVTLAVVMLEGYFEWLEDTGADQGLETIGVETIVDVPAVGLPGVHLLGKLDRRVRREIDGATLFMDHKTVQSIDQTVAQAYLSPQFRHYHLLEYLEALNTGSGERTDGVLINMLRKVGRGKTAKPPFYAREEVHHNPHVLRSHWTHVIGEILEILETREALDVGADHHSVVPPSPGRDCEWRCIFRPICPMFDDGGDVRTVIQLSYTETDPLSRYGDDDESEDA